MKVNDDCEKTMKQRIDAVHVGSWALWLCEQFATSHASLVG